MKNETALHLHLHHLSIFDTIKIIIHNMDKILCYAVSIDNKCIMLQFCNIWEIHCYLNLIAWYRITWKWIGITFHSVLNVCIEDVCGRVKSLMPVKNVFLFHHNFLNGLEMDRMCNGIWVIKKKSTHGSNLWCHRKEFSNWCFQFKDIKCSENLLKNSNLL